MNKPITLIEVGLRDGLQNVSMGLTTDQKISLIQKLKEAGLTHIEVGSFVRPDRVPQMADTAELAQRLSQRDPFWYLVPNLKGLTQALSLGVTHLAFFTAASDAFNQKNIGMTLEQSITTISQCVEHIKTQGYRLNSLWDPSLSDRELRLRLYISTVVGCPYSGSVSPQPTLKLIEALYPLGFSQISLGDTIGVGTPKKWDTLLSQIKALGLPPHAIAMHCHDTYGTALTCVMKGLEKEIRFFDSSIGGLGGCPYAPGATGNLATEDLVYLLEQEGYDTGVDLNKLGTLFSPELTGGLINNSRVVKALFRRP